jgi:hypothetical protein
MSQRYIVGLEAGADWQHVQRAAVAAGADWTRNPSPAQPDVLVVSIPDGMDADRFVAACRRTPGVRYVEADSMRWSS